MTNFNDLFDQWAPHYDETVYGSNHEYEEVFLNYQEILKKIATEAVTKVGNTVLEIGTGTGNLARELLAQGGRVIGIEPSEKMRQLTRRKLPELELYEGHFLSLPPIGPFDAIVSSYALHHLTLEEKQQAIPYLLQFLKPGGKMIIADTMFTSPEVKKELLHRAEAQQAFNLLNDLKSEYYELLEDYLAILEDHHLTYTKVQMNPYVWVVSAQGRPW